MAASAFGMPTAHADPPSPIPEPVLPPLAPGQVLRIGPTAGTGTPTRDYGIGATDLCEFMEFPSGILQVCGDSFAGQGVGFGGWYSPIALHVETDSIDDPTGVRYDGVTGTDKPLLADPTPPGESQLPAGVVQINRDNYMMVTTAKDLRPQSSRLVKASPAQGNWPTLPGSQRDAGFEGGRQSQISGYYDPIPTADSPTGWVYIVANNFDRTGPVVLYRAKRGDLHRPGQLAGLVVGRRLEQAPDAAVAGPGRRDEHSADRRQDGAVVLQRQQRQHGDAGRRQPDRTWRRAGHHCRVRKRMAGSRRGSSAARGTTGWRSRTAATSRRDPRSTRCACSSVSGTPLPRAAMRRTASSSSR